MPKQANLAEDVVEEVLRKLKRDSLISGFLRNRSNDRLDSEGIDFLIFLPNGYAIPLQVKTANGRYPKEEKLKEHLRKHPCVKFLICVQTNFFHSKRERLYKIVEQELKSILKQLSFPS